MSKRCPLCGKFMALESEDEFWKNWRCHGITKYDNQCPYGEGEAKYENWPSIKPKPSPIDRIISWLKRLFCLGEQKE